MSKKQWLKRFIKTDPGIALLIACAWQLGMTALGIIFDFSFSPRPLSGVEVTALSHTSVWDAGWYESIINGAYRTNPGAPVFYPLFPALVVVMKFLSFDMLSNQAAGLLVNTLCIWMAVTALVKISDFFLDKKYRWLTVSLFLTFPAAIFLHMFYAEALFCALAFGAYLFALKRRWGLMAILLALLGATRFPAVLFVGLCGLEYLRAHQWSIKKALNLKLLWFGLVPLGFIIYGFYLRSVTGDFFAMLHGYDRVADWSYHVFNPNIFYTLARESYNTALLFVGRRDLTALFVANTILPLASLAALFATSAYALFASKKKDHPFVPLGIFGLVSIVFFTLNNNLVSVHRYVLPCLVVYIGFLSFLSGSKKYFPIIYLVLYLSVMAQAYLFILFVGGRFAG